MKNQLFPEKFSDDQILSEKLLSQIEILCKNNERFENLPEIQKKTENEKVDPEFLK